ncbi:MAG: sugar phosphate nucleotidyltransferase [Bacillota bacterium]
MKAVIMAGGEGARLRPLTCERPKPMVPLLGRPMMEYILRLLQKHDLQELAVTLQYLPERIKEHFGSGEEWGVSLNYFLEKEPLGTAGSVKNAASMLDQTFLVISGDCLTDMDLTEAIRFHRRKRALVTIVLTPREDPLEYGIVITDAEGKISRFLEKPSWGEVFSDTVNTGIYILEPEVLRYVPDGKQFDFSRDLFPLLLKEGKALFGCVLPGYWCDIGSLEQYLQAQHDMLSGKVTVDIPAGEKEKGVWISPGVELEEGSRLLPPVFIGPGSRICSGATVGEFAVIGTQNYIGPGAVVKRGVTWEGVNLAARAAVKGGILGQKVLLEERAVVYEDAVLGDKSILGEESVIRPGVKVWPYKRVESGVILRSNLVWGSRACRFLFGFDGVKGRLNGELGVESAVSLGAAFGSMLGRGKRVVVGSEAGTAANLLKDAAKIGLISVGLEVYELGETTCSMARLGVNVYGAQGGIYLYTPAGEKDCLCLRFFDGEGMNLSRGDERKLEQLYYRDDFTRVSPTALVEEVRVTGMVDKYREHLAGALKARQVQKRKFKLALSCPAGLARTILLDLLEELGCTLYYLPLPSDNTVSPQRFARETVREIVEKMAADLGAVLCPDGERLFLTTAHGRLLEDEELQALITLLQLRYRQLSSVAVPVTAPRVHEELARRYRGQVVRTRTSPRQRMEGLRGTGLPFLPQAFDGTRTLLELLDFMAAEQKSLEQLLQEIPPFYLKEKRIPCPWNQKGRVMRRLVEEAGSEQVEMIEGLKVYRPGGWALVLPDPEEPAYRIIGEGCTEESAGSLADYYLERVRVLQQE